MKNALLEEFFHQYFFFSANFLSIFFKLGMKVEVSKESVANFFQIFQNFNIILKRDSKTSRGFLNLRF